VSLLESVQFCELRHRGLSIDLGSDWGDSHRSFHVGSSLDVEPTLRAGSSSGRVRTRKLVYDFWMDAPARSVSVSFRAQGEAASQVILFVDGRRVGAARLTKETSKVHQFGPFDFELSAGRHELVWRFIGGSRVASTPVALLDWVRLFLPDNGPQSYSPAVKQSVLQDVVLGDVPREGLAIRAPGSVRCPLLSTTGTRVVVDVGYWGVGEGVAQVVAVTADSRRVVLAERKVVGNDTAQWLELDLALDAFDGQLIGLEFAALESTAAGRVVFAEPRLVKTRPEAQVNLARNVVVVIAGGLSRRLIPPWSDRQGKGSLFDLADQGVVFEGYRTTSTLVSAVVGSLLSGFPPGATQMLDASARLPERVPLLSEAMRKEGGRNAFFTNVPYTAAAFGFNRGWHDFVEISPVANRPATEPFLLAKRWLETDIQQAPERRRLVVMHVRGGHPPWDVSSDEAQLLPPKDYEGVIEPRRAASVLRDFRNRSARSARKLSPQDIVRLDALQDAAIRKHDVGLGMILKLLEATGQLEQSMVVYVGDVGMVNPPAIPFAPVGRLQTSRLTPPLIVRFPNRLGAGTRNASFVSPTHLANTLYRALGIPVPDKVGGPDLFDVLQGGSGVQNLGSLARQGNRYAYHLGKWRLRGALGETPRLCNMEVDPACQQDQYLAEPMTAHWLWRSALRSFQLEGGGGFKRENAEVDETTGAALSVYGL
jgi:arylsulfatase A-like enzyme